MEIDLKLATRQSRRLLEMIDRLSSEKQGMGELVSTLMETIEKQNESMESLRARIANQDKENQERIEALNKRIQWLELENRHQREIIDARNKRLFGRKSEKMSHDESQYWLFNEIESVVRERVVTAEPPVPVKGYTRRKPGRKPIPDNLPRIVILHDLSKEEIECTTCHKPRPQIGEEIWEELSMIPLRLFVKRHRHPKYGPCDCEACQDEENTQPVISAPHEKRIIPGSMADEIVLAYLATSKFCDSLPFYRQEKIMRRYGIEYGRETMCNQMIRISEACSGLIELMWKDARSGPILNMDETRLQVLNEPGRDPSALSWMWVMIGRPEGKKVIMFHYHQKRSGEVARKLLEGYRGYLQSDGYSAYHAVGNTGNIISVGCWAHARRKFVEAKGLPEHACHADEALAMIARLFHIDSTLREKNLTENDFVALRREQTQPVFDELFCWLHDTAAKVPPSFNLAKAIRYAINEWDRLIRYLDHAYLTPDNNVAENAIRPFVVGRKNWLFASTPRGAHASATLYTLIESSKANGLDPLDYLAWLFTALPRTQEANLRGLLPYAAEPSQVNGFVTRQRASLDGGK